MKILQLFFYLSRFQQQLDRMEIKMGAIEDLKARLEHVRDETKTIRQLVESGPSSPATPAAEPDLSEILTVVDEIETHNQATLVKLEGAGPPGPLDSGQLPNEPDPGPIEDT